jgi:glucose-6-phosphate isomerase
MLFLLSFIDFFFFQDMVVLPYKDSLLLLSRYLQQLVMESLGKEFDLDGNRVKSLPYSSQFTLPDVFELLGLFSSMFFV